jgi:hypothetical protein
VIHQHELLDPIESVVNRIESLVDRVKAFNDIVLLCDLAESALDHRSKGINCYRPFRHTSSA